MSSVYPAIPYPDQSIQGLTQSVLALKQAVDILTGVTDNAAAPKGYVNSQNYNVQSYISTMGATVEELSTIQTNQQGVLQARYGVTVDVNHKITGISLLADSSGASSFDVRADSFNVYATGYSTQPVFSVGTIGGVAQVTINGAKLADLSTNNNAINNNAVSNSATSVGPRNSGYATITVRPSSRIIVIAFYYGGDSSTQLTTNMYIAINGTIYPGAPIPGDTSGSFRSYFACATTQTLVDGGSGGTYTASAYTDNSTMTAGVTVYIQELAK